MLRNLTLGFALSVVFAQVAAAQYAGGYHGFTYNHVIPIRHHVVPVYGYGHYGYHGGYSAYGSYGNGRAQVIRAQGDAFEAITRGLVNLGEANRRAIENKKLAIERRWETKRLAQGELEKDRQANRDRVQNYLAARLERQAESQEVAMEVVVGGQIDWPVVLQDARYNLQREQMDQVFADMKTRGMNATTQQKMATLKKEMLAKLKSQMKEIPGNDYLHAKRFLEQLAG